MNTATNVAPALLRMRAGDVAYFVNAVETAFFFGSARWCVACESTGFELRQQLSLRLASFARVVSENPQDVEPGV